jgi:cytochrome c-type biogenesis protein CcsB
VAINTALESLSDQAFGGATAAYTVALMCAAIEFASRRTTRPVSAQREPAFVGALTRDGTAGGVPIVPTATPVGETGSGAASANVSGFGRVEQPAPGRAPWGERFGSAALLVTIVGFVAHVISMWARGFSAGRLPLGNMYEFTSAICATAVGAWLVVKLRNRSLAIGVFVLVPVTLLMYISGAILHVPAAELQAALNSYWKWIHVTSVALSSGVLIFSGILSALYLLRQRFDRPREESGAGVESLWARLPVASTLDRVAYRTAVLAFPVYTFAVITGALWAEVAWGRYWNWDPKETVAFVTWVIYAGYLHARSTAGWRGTKAAWISVVGLASIVFNLFFVNIVIPGLHSYAGLN